MLLNLMINRFPKLCRFWFDSTNVQRFSDHNHVFDGKPVLLNVRQENIRILNLSLLEISGRFPTLKKNFDFLTNTGFSNVGDPKLN